MRSAGNGERRRQELADFLRTKRASLQPEDVGLPDGGRRRTPGLRREEVALLAGVGTTWYTWLEQGRDVRASLEVLEAVSRALRLTPGRARARDPARARRAGAAVQGAGRGGLAHAAPPGREPRARARPTCSAAAGTTWPGTSRSSACSAGSPARSRCRATTSGCGSWIPPAARCARATGRPVPACSWPSSAADSASNIGDPAFEELISALESSSPEFRKLWKRHEVAGSGDGRKELIHPVVGPLTFDHAVFRHGDSGEQRLVLYTPACEHETRAKLAQLVEDPTRTRASSACDGCRCGERASALALTLSRRVAYPRVTSVTFPSARSSTPLRVA